MLCPQLFRTFASHGDLSIFGIRQGLFVQSRKRFLVTEHSYEPIAKEPHAIPFVAEFFHPLLIKRF